MSPRPRDWHPLADRDPIPGDPDEVAALGRKLRKTAEELERQIANLKAVAEVDSWDSKAGKEFREKATGSVKKLKAALTRYDSAADALGDEVTEVGGGYQDKSQAKPTNYATDLNRAQQIADAALRDAKDADERKGTAQRSLDGLSDRGKDKADRKKLEEQRDSAGDELNAAHQKITRAVEIRNEAANRASAVFENLAKLNDSLKDDFWDQFDGWVDSIGSWAEEYATYLGVAALAVGWVPIIGQALAGGLGALATIATLISSVATLIQVIRGDKGLKDLAFTVLGIVTMGVGKAFAKVAGRYAKEALRAMNRADLARTSKQVNRADKKLNVVLGRKAEGDASLVKRTKLRVMEFKPESGEGWKSMKEVFTEPFSKSVADNMKILVPGQGNYRAMWEKIVIRGDGNAALGLGRSVSGVDPGIASDLKDLKFAARRLDDYGQINELSTRATVASVLGTGLTSFGMGLDGNLNPLLG
ncbi:hypothetical protein [Streptomyces sp. NPDC048002]|uniref:hypothetical protein n=1 Tax=Streptomyces sp. NPDC048002 TaxID=3154344 RepID=UPI0033D9B3F3